MSGFSFAFSSEDIDIGLEENAPIQAGVPINGASKADNISNPALLPASLHSLEEILATLPSKIAYSFLTIPCSNGGAIRLPRRELFDIRVQLMAEDEELAADGESVLAAAGLEDSDIKTNVYEGGFKSWECSLDLVRYLVDRKPLAEGEGGEEGCGEYHVVELGCGTALPTLTLLHTRLSHPESPSPTSSIPQPQSPKPKPTSLPLHLTLADYNFPVLRLVTVPNLLLTYCCTLPASSPLLPPGFHDYDDDEKEGRLGGGGGGGGGGSGDLPITPGLIQAFLSTLEEKAVRITLLSGSWDPVDAFVGLVPISFVADVEAEGHGYGRGEGGKESGDVGGGAGGLLVLASETIYSPPALQAFTAALLALLSRGSRAQVQAQALVAAKRVYFGVGGGIDAFKYACEQGGATAKDVDWQGDLGEGGVRRGLVRVRLNT